MMHRSALRSVTFDQKSLGEPSISCSPVCAGCSLQEVSYSWHQAGTRPISRNSGHIRHSDNCDTRHPQSLLSVHTCTPAVHTREPLVHSGRTRCPQIFSQVVARSSAQVSATALTRPRTQARPLDGGAVIHDHSQSCRAGSIGRGRIDHPQLKPDGAGTDFDGLVDVGAGLGRASEDVHDIDIFGDLGEGAHPGADRGLRRPAD